MKNIIYILAAVVFAFTACEKESFDYASFKVSSSDIDSVYFSTGSKTLIADGKASLQFVLETFRTVQVEGEGGASIDSLMFVDYKKLPESDIQIFADGEPINGFEYSTTDLEKETVEFYAKVGDKVSAKKQVFIRSPQLEPDKRYVDLIFHVFELNATDDSYDPLTYQQISKEQLEEAVRYANVVFNNINGKDANGASANFEFRLAERNAAGVVLEVPGINRIVYDSSWKASPTAVFMPANFINRINSTPAYQWDKEQFVNIYVLPLAANSAIGDNRAAYQIVPSGELPLEGISNRIQHESEVPSDNFFNIFGLGIHRTVFFPDDSRNIEIAGYLGKYYGLYSTHSTTSEVVDYLGDTKKYNSSVNNSKSLLKVGLDGEKFLANNAMDDIRYASLRNSFTLDQINRMRTVMEWSPVRKAWKTN